MTLRMRKAEIVVFDIPPIKKQRFWVPVEVKIELKRGLILIFRVSEHFLDMNIERSRIGQGK